MKWTKCSEKLPSQGTHTWVTNYKDVWLHFWGPMSISIVLQELAWSDDIQFHKVPKRKFHHCGSEKWTNRGMWCCETDGESGLLFVQTNEATWEVGFCLFCGKKSEKI